MNIFKKILMFIFDQTHKGNFIPLGLFLAALYYIAMPLYGLAMDRIGANTQANTEIAIDVYELRKELAELKKDVDNEFKDREPGVMGYTKF